MATKLKNEKLATIWLLLLICGLTNLTIAWNTFFYYSLGLLVLSGIAMLLLALFLNRKYQISKISGFGSVESVYNWFPIDVRLGVLGLSAIYFFICSGGYIQGFDFRAIFLKYIFTASAILVILLQGQWLTDDLNDQPKRRKSWQGSLVVKMGHTLRDAFSQIPAGWQVFGTIALVFFLGMSAPVLLFVFNNLLVPLFFLSVIGLPLLFWIFKRVAVFNQMYLDVAATAAGSDQPDLPRRGSGILNQLAANLNTLKRSVRASRREQVKSERLKTELITNVSHDLRTPLTSIITYSGLLKNPDLKEDEKKDYLGIIDRKAKRLKRLIDDLFEVSKMASGAIDLHKEKVDFTELMTQALAEYDEPIQEGALEFRLKFPEKPLYAFVDGQKIWRVFDNLISNILKYSLEHTRVYLSLGEENGEVVAVFKNITKYELGANIDELFERFKRGDASRHTEGSGLGLAIAKSIVDLHDGLFEIDLDGDLFKVTMKLPAVD
ncbi:sensor histidine kinase [Sporolactobacillus pectinivorans]|uniref:sensor histidine kinase n=1 Tax=Sporolactobacillus pectinivorans TaxID=1591408 RepID=UPI001EFE845F|nr:HAMP domain-containing sensor histidine kinase [Sporolactobacillus pectinivorans]